MKFSCCRFLCFSGRWRWSSKIVAYTPLPRSKTNCKQLWTSLRQMAFRPHSSNTRNSGTRAFLCKISISKEMLLKLGYLTYFVVERVIVRELFDTLIYKLFLSLILKVEFHHHRSLLERKLAFFA